jgi:phenylalanyl-tRNA synthetase beta chain
MRDTRNIILECANFDMYSIRKTSMANGIFTDAVTRFSKGQSPLQNMAVLAQIVDDVTRISGGKVASEPVDDNHLSDEIKTRNALHADVKVSIGFINDRLGLQLSADDMAELLTNVEFEVKIDADNLTIRAPFWRTDIEISEDIVEEVGRLYGFDTLPLDLPVRSIIPASRNHLLDVKSRVREVLSAAGANEVLTYSFVHGNLLQTAGQDQDLAFKLGNALSPELQYYRVSLTPSLLERVNPNIRAGYDEFALFELGKGHVKGEQDAAEPAVPKEANALSFVYAKRTPGTGAPYYQAAKYLDQLLESFHADMLVRLEPLEGADLYKNPWLVQMTAPYEPKRSAVLRDVSGGDSRGRIWGVVGEFRSSVRKSLKLPDYSAGFEIDPLLLSGPGSSHYKELPRFPKVSQDISLKVPQKITFRQVYETVQGIVENEISDSLSLTVSPVDIYQREDDPEHKQITLRLTVASYERTLTDTEVTKLLDAAAAEAEDKLGAERL